MSLRHAPQSMASMVLYRVRRLLLSEWPNRLPWDHVSTICLRGVSNHTAITCQLGTFYVLVISASAYCWLPSVVHSNEMQRVSTRWNAEHRASTTIDTLDARCKFSSLWYRHVCLSIEKPTSSWHRVRRCCVTASPTSHNFGCHHVHMH